MRIYISGPITGVENYLEHFKAAEEYWTSKGFSCINPAALDTVLPKDLTYEQHMDIDMYLMDMCDTIYLLKGWENSRGANREYGYALGKEFMILKELDELDPSKQGMPNPFVFDTASADVMTDTLITEEGSADNNSVASKNDSNDSDNKKAKNESGGATRGRKATIDIGKILALKNAGWPHAKIADEMRMDVKAVTSAIYRYKKKEGTDE